MDDRSSFTTPSGSTSSGWVDVTKGVVRREAFVNNDVYERELTQIFERKWIYLAHETEIPNPGDYVTRTLGNAPVVVIRGADNAVHAVLNSCRHRGSQLCRADAGNIRRFICPYHGWSYERDGTLITTTFDSFMPKDMDFAEWSLVRVASLESYHGMIFGCWDANVESLADYLGDFTYYLDAFMARTPRGMEVLAPPHRWRVKANWKVGALNFIGDGQHTPTTHVGPLTLDPVRAARSGFAVRADTSVQLIVDGGHGCTLTYLAPGLPEGAYETHPHELLPLYQASLGARKAKMLEKLRIAVGTIFPNLSFIETQVSRGEKAVIMRLWHPISGSEMEMMSWVFAEREASAEYKARLISKGLHNFGIAGIFEQDDVELWESATFASRNSVSQKFPYSFHTAVPYRNTPLADHDGPGRAFKPSASEVIQFEFMRHWDQLMTAEVR